MSNPCDSPPRRVSRRSHGEPPICAWDSIKESPVKELKMLARSGGRGGKLYDDENEWDFFHDEDSESCSEDELDVHEHIEFSSIQDVTDSPHEYENDETKVHDDCEYQLVNMRALESYINETFVCRCALEREVDNFLRYCARSRKTFSMKQLRECKSNWYRKKRNTDKAQNTLSLTTENIGLAGMVTTHCSHCNKSSSIPLDESMYKGTSYNGEQSNRENCSWYSINLRLVIGTLASGMGAADISCLFSFLGLPNLQSFCHRQYRRIENLIGRHLRDVANESMDDALDHEVTLTQENKNVPVTDWKNMESQFGLTLSYDMGWSKRSSGHTYDSLSGHGFLIGGYSRKIVDAQVTSKLCSTCSSAEAKGVEAPTHDCPRNFHGSSKAMEAHGALSLVIKLDKKTDSKIYVEAFVTDDDTSIRSLLSHDHTHNGTGKGKLPQHIPEPRWLADPSHRTRVVARAIFALVTLRVGEEHLKKVDALRFKKNFGYMLKQGRSCTLEVFQQKAKAVIYHMFNEHRFCDPAWCKPLRMEQKCSADGVDDSSTSDENSQVISDEEDIDKKVSYYRSMTKHKALFDLLWKTYQPYITPERLIESMHEFDTQLNEALNNVVARYAPKNRTYGTTMSLSNRISIVIGIHNMGHLSYWDEVFKRCRIESNIDLIDNLARMDNHKDWKRKYNSKTEVKQRRVKAKNERMQTLTKQQIHDIERGLIYENGFAVNVNIPDNVLKIEQQLREEGKVKCPLYGCHGKTHKSMPSKNCIYHGYHDNNEFGKCQQKKLMKLYPSQYCTVITD